MAKMNGIGNSILVIDMRASRTGLEKQAVLTLAKARETFFDQIMALYPPHAFKHFPKNSARFSQNVLTADCFMEIWNRDGSFSGACGNGTRCVVDYLYRCGGKKSFILQTDNGLLHAERQENGEICVDMGAPTFEWDKIPIIHPVEDTLYVSFAHALPSRISLSDASLVSMGNPHAIFFVEEDIHSFELKKYGPILEHDKLFTNKANISIARVHATDALEMRTWERGADLTRACGSAACAAAVAAFRRGLTERLVRVTLPGGTLHIEWREGDGHVLMQGGVVHEFSGWVDPKTGKFERG